MLHLAVAAFEVDWGKLNSVRLHGALFQQNALKDVPYRYLHSDDEVRTKTKEGLSAPLSSILPRLELLGFTLAAVKHEFAIVTELASTTPLLSFDQLANALRSTDLDEAAQYYTEDHDFGEFFEREISVPLGLDKIPSSHLRAQREIGQAMENLHPFAALRLLAENPANLDRQVTWYFADEIESGHIDRTQILREIGANRKFLIVTEGSSDAKVIKKALTLLRPEIADFFYFVDMQEGYPFTGIGNLHRFCQGLVSIGIENRIIVIYDNDTEGRNKFAETLKLTLPDNMRVIRLPDLPALNECDSQGPNGLASANINGRAAAIEVFLDLRIEDHDPPFVRWTGHNPASNSYQGELDDKQAYVRRFLDLRTLDPLYDFSKLRVLLDEIVDACVSIAERAILKSPDGAGSVSL